MVRKNESLNYNLKRMKSKKISTLKIGIAQKIMKEEYDSYSDQYFILYFKLYSTVNKED
jgi:hypothetical protein